MGSIKDAIHTLPSIEADAICIEFEGVGGIGTCWADLGFSRILPELADVRDGGRISSAAGLLEASSLILGRGGGKGDIDMDVTLAECAWYTRRGCKKGKERTCWLRRISVRLSWMRPGMNHLQ